MKQMSKNKGSISSYDGFTLIELLVVIAIIGILGAIVLGALNGARQKGNASAVKSELNQARIQADLFYEGDYAGVCSEENSASNIDPKGIYHLVKKAGEVNNFKGENTVNINGAGTGASVRCNVSDDSVFWAAQVQLRNEDGTLSDTYWCVDSGRRGGVSNDLGDTGTQCDLIEETPAQ